MERHEIEAWLGDDWTPEQTGTIVDRITAWESAHPDADADEQGRAWTAITQQVDGTLDLAEVAGSHYRARLAAAEARDVLRASVWAACAYGGVSEAEASRVAGVDRMTIRAWLGKANRNR